MATIVVVEDDQDIQALLRDLLVEEGHTVVSCMPSGAHACIEQRRPDVVLLDLMMPVRSGEQIFRDLRGDARTAAIPIIIISATVRVATTARALRPEAVLPKPFSINDLLVVLQEVLTNPHPRTSPAPDA